MTTYYCTCTYGIIAIPVPPDASLTFTLKAGNPSDAMIQAAAKFYALVNGTNLRFVKLEVSTTNPDANT